jgi:kinesin family protein 18/19
MQQKEDRKEDKFTVVVRVRPLSQKERFSGAVEVVQVVGESVVVVTDPPAADDDYLRVNRSREKKFAFDCAFDARASQKQVFERTTGPLIEDVLNGFNATVFAYGPTGSGKTFSMCSTH